MTHFVYYVQIFKAFHIIPLALIQLGLFAVALWDLIKRKRVAGGNKLVWVLVIVLIGFIGPILYLTIGRKDD